MKQQKARKAFDEFLEMIETRWCRPDSFRHRWSFFTADDHPVSVIAFPCRVQQGRESWGAIHYLTAMVESGPPVWRFAGFAWNEESYFVLDLLARQAIGIVADVEPDQVPPGEINKIRQNFNFLVLYGGEVGQGFSHTGAVIVLMVICYLHVRLGPEFAAMITFDPATVISAEADVQTGDIRAIEGLEDKITSVLEQWGHDARIHIPAANESEARRCVRELRPDMADIDAIIRPVATVQELIHQTLGSLEEAHTAWLARIGPYEFDTQWKARVNIRTIDQWEKLHTDQETEPGHHTFCGPIIGRCVQQGATMRIFTGFSAAACHPELATPQRAIVLAISGCTADFAGASEDAVLWPSPPQLSLPAQLVHAIAEALWHQDTNQDQTTLFVHFLSSSEPALILDSIMNGREIDNRLRTFREKHQLNQRGRYLRPVIDYWLTAPARIGQYDLTELVVISNCEVPDIADELYGDDLAGFINAGRILVGDSGNICSWIKSRDQDILLNLSDAKIDPARIRAQFGPPPYALKRLKIDCQGICPVRWQATAGAWGLTKSVDGAFCLETDFPNGAITVDITFQTLRPLNTVDLEIEYQDDASGKAQTGRAPQLGFYPGEVAPMQKSPSGVLTPEEYARLQSEQWCSECRDMGNRCDHLLCDLNAGIARHRITLTSLQHFWESVSFASGLFLICSNTGEWRFSDTGHPLEDAAVVLCQGQPLVVAKDGSNHPPADLHDIHEIVDNGKTYYFFKV